MKIKIDELYKLKKENKDAKEQIKILFESIEKLKNKIKKLKK